MPTLVEVTELALALPEGDRAQLAHSLMASLPDDVAYDVEGWLEADRRSAEMDADPSACMTWEEVQAKMRERFPHLKRSSYDPAS
jgi:putative addiction module component (TIGR02574 family)